jgi:hypothetical protein
MRPRPGEALLQFEHSFKKCPWEHLFHSPHSVRRTAGMGGAMSTYAIYDPDRWRRRAEEMRRIADDMTVIGRAKAEILRIAEDFEVLAVRADGRMKGAKLAG